MGRGSKYDAQAALDQMKTKVPAGAFLRLGVAVGGLGLAAAAFTSLYTVQGGFRAVKFNLLTGLSTQTYGAGTHIRLPLLEQVTVFDVRQQPISIQSSQGSRDLQIVNTTVRVLFKANENDLPELYRRIGQNYADVVLPSISNEAQYNASELITRRPEVSAAITQELLKRAKDFYLDIIDVSIVQMNFGKEYTSAVEAKQIAQQMAERARFKVEQAQQEKKGTIILAEGEAESAKLIGEAVRDNKAFIELRRMEAANEISLSLAKSPNKLTIDSGSLLLNVGSEASLAKATK